MALITPPLMVMVDPSGLTAPKADRDARGISADTKDRNVGAAAEPLEGPAKIVLADWVFSAAVSVPEVAVSYTHLTLPTIYSV